MRTKRPAFAAIAIALTVTAATAQSKKPPAPAPTLQPPAAAAPANSPDVDVVYGAYQRGWYRTAFAEATKRVDEKNDVKAMTLLAELYADGLGVAKDEVRRRRTGTASQRDAVTVRPCSRSPCSR